MLRRGLPISLIALAAVSCGNVTVDSSAPAGPDAGPPAGPETGAPAGPDAGAPGNDGGGDGGIDASNDGGRKPSAVAADAGAPASWQEHWFEHNQLLRKVADTEDDVLYFDNDVDISSAAWIQPLLANMWRYTKQTYGVPGDPRLFAVFHSGRYPGEHSASIFDPAHDYRNVIDLGGGAMAWADPTCAYKIAYSAGQVLEKSVLGFDTLPSIALTNFQFGYFFAYDVLKVLGMTPAAEAWLNSLMTFSVDNPRPGTFWSRDWYFPLWRDHGGAAVFARFMNLVAANYPKVPRNDGNGRTFARAMNWGEYVHFMSGAAGTDLKMLATKAFGWPVEWDDQYRQAKLDFSTISYGAVK